MFVMKEIRGEIAEVENDRSIPLIAKCAMSGAPGGTRNLRFVFSATQLS